MAQERRTEEHGAMTEKNMDTISVPRLWSTRSDGEVRLRLSRHGPGHEAPMTIPELFQESVERFGAYPALASKNGKKWDTVTFSQYYEVCCKAARSLIKLGLQRFHGVGILGTNCVEWVVAALGTILAGGLCVGIYATNSAEACQYVINHAKVNVLMVENDQQLQKILSIPADRMKTLKAIVQYKLPLMRSGRNLYSWHDFIELGNSIPSVQLDRIILSQKANQCAVIIYTSGTSGTPKGVMLSHDNITWTAGAVLRDFDLMTHVAGKQDIIVSYLPLSHISAQMLDIWIAIKAGMLTFFAQPDALRSLETTVGGFFQNSYGKEVSVSYVQTLMHTSENQGTLVYTLQEVKPTIFLGVPCIWEKMQDTIKQNVAKSSSLRKKAFAWAKILGLKVNTKRLLGKREMPMNYRMAKTLVFAKVRSSLGLENCHSFVSGAAPLPQDVLEFFLSLDIPIGELYGLSECSGPHSVSTPSTYRVLSCGKVLNGCKTMLSQQNKDGVGEVCMWGRHIFMGYLASEEATMENIDEEGWLHSGDMGRLDSHEFLYITGRIKEILVMAGGENVAPLPIESLVKEKIPIVSHAVLVGDKAKFLSMLLTLKCETDQTSGEPLDKLNPEALSFCRALGSNAETVADVVRHQDPVIYTAIQYGIDLVNQEALSEEQKIQKWTILEKELSIHGGELGPTSKLRRRAIAHKYRAQIESMYT